jgi:hypothetical protein
MFRKINDKNLENAERKEKEKISLIICGIPDNRS